MSWTLALLVALAGSSSPAPLAPAPELESAFAVTRITIGGLPPGKRVLLLAGGSGARIVEERTDCRGFKTVTILVPARISPPAASSPAVAPGKFYPASSPLLSPASGSIGRGTEAQGFSFDSFAGANLAPTWQVLNPAAAEVSVSGGELHLRPLLTGPDATWFDDGEGVYVHREVTGNFTARALARATSVSDSQLPPAPQYRLGGLLVRDPSSSPGDRNSLHLALGAGDNAFPVAVEDKTTTDSNSTFFFHALATASAELRIRRTGAIFTLEYRAASGTPWQLARIMNRPDLPQKLQIGMMAYSFQPNADMRVSFADFRLQSSL